jgi:hypothetical protein
VANGITINKINGFLVAMRTQQGEKGGQGRPTIENSGGAEGTSSFENPGMDDTG